MQVIVKRGFGLVALAAVVGACAAKEPAASEQTGESTEALGEMACTTFTHGANAPPDGHYGMVTTANSPNGCSLDLAIISNDNSYGFAGCPNQFVYNINHVTSTANNAVVVVPHDNIAQADCANTFVTLGMYARDDHQDNPWTLIGTGTKAGVWNNGACSWDPPMHMPTTSAYTSYMLAASAYTNVVWKGVTNPSYKLVYVAVRPC